jgi:3-isopropylmalate/(R)-2-methylmalate dehydratase small subunit
VISSSFADIFYNNCFKNGILPIKIDNKIVIELADYSKRKDEIEINLEKQEIKYGNKVVKFEVDAFKKKCLMEGLDDIALSMTKISQIDNFEKRLIENKPWLIKND